MSSTDIPSAPGIYRITCTVTGLFYIGSAINLSNRWAVHCYEFRRTKHRNPRLQHAWNKYGPDAFTFEILELVLPIFLIEREQYWLDTLQPFGKKGFNIDRIAGSRLGMKHTPETRAKISAAGLGLSHGKGRKLSPEQRARLNVASTAATMKKLIVIAPDGTEYTIIGISKFCREHGLHHPSLMKVANGEMSQHHGWKARYF